MSKPKSPGRAFTDDGVQIGAVVIDEAVNAVDEVADFLNVRIEDAEGVGAGEHQSRDVVVQGFFEGVHIHIAFFVAGDGLDLVARDGCAGGICAVGAIGNKDGIFFVAFIFVVCAHNHNAGKFTVGTRHRLHRKSRHSGNFAQEPNPFHKAPAKPPA